MYYAIYDVYFPFISALNLWRKTTLYIIQWIAIAAIVRYFNITAQTYLKHFPLGVLWHTASQPVNWRAMEFAASLKLER